MAGEWPAPAGKVKAGRGMEVGSGLAHSRNRRQATFELLDPGEPHASAAFPRAADVDWVNVRMVRAGRFFAVLAIIRRRSSEGRSTPRRTRRVTDETVRVDLGDRPATAAKCREFLFGMLQ
jgi:hypothetical protein